MSKTSLKKELLRLDHDQMVQLMLEAYETNAAIKEYLEFFLNPDVEALLEKHQKAIMKELNRSRWGYSKARVSLIKKAVKHFMGFNPGVEAVLDMLFLTLSSVGMAERYLNFKETQMNYVSFLTRQILQTAESNACFAPVMSRLEAELEKTNYTRYFKQYVSEGIAGFTKN